MAGWMDVCAPLSNRPSDSKVLCLSKDKKTNTYLHRAWCSEAPVSVRSQPIGSRQNLGCKAANGLPTQAAEICLSGLEGEMIWWFEKWNGDSSRHGGKRILAWMGLGWSPSASAPEGCMLVATRQ